MKNINYFRLTGNVILVSLVVTFGCKKNEPEITPIPNPPAPVTRDVFTDQKINMMSDFEIQHKRSMQAHGMYKNMVGIGPVDVFKAAFGIFSSIEKYRRDQETQQEINNINSSLNNIQSQLTTLENDFASLAAELNYDMTELMNELYDLSTITTTAPIITAFSDADQNGFRWYSAEAKSHNSGSEADSLFFVNTLTPAMNQFITAYTTGVQSTTLQNAIQELNGYIIPSATSKGLLNILVRNIVAQNKSSEPLEQYMILENYFLQVANYQFQALVVQLNCFKDDTADFQSFYSWYSQLFIPEIQQFLQASNLLAVSLYDYRNESQFNADLDYLEYGISPETNLYKMLARAQFVANLLYDACSVPIPVICGSIVLPYYYNNGTGQTPLSPFGLSVSGKTLAPRTDTLIRSPFPYTYWNMGTQTFYPDNQWKLFCYGKFGVADPGWSCTPQVIQLSNTSWGATQQAQGKVTPLWYNPRNPQQTSTTKTDSCFIQFAYFAASWKWGYWGPSFAPSSQRANLALDPLSNIGSTSDNCKCPGDMPSVPFVSQFHSSECKMEGGGSGSVSYVNNRLFQGTFSGTYIPYSDGQIYASDFYGWNATSPGSSGIGPSVSLYLNYSWNHSTGTSIKHHFFKIGTGLTAGGCFDNYYNSKGDILNTGSFSGGSSSGGPTTVVVDNLSTGTSYLLNLEVEMGVWETKDNYSFNIQTSINGQFVYMGRYSTY